MKQFISKKEKETAQVAEKILKKALKKGSSLVLALYGDLGAGKTTFTKAIAKTLGVEDEVLSPTFLLIREYDLPVSQEQNQGGPEKIGGAVKLFHVDAYRIDDPTELSDLGLEEQINDTKSIVVIEWADRVEDLIPKDATRIYFKATGENEREIKVSSTS